ncbi:MAG: response regulator [Cyclobacteriaceae bacterium]|nr:response regulator [Cyclobacteriaceae bacterium]
MGENAKRILIADDSPVIQTLSRKIFLGMGYDIVGLKSGSKVIEQINSKKFDVVILDIILPGVDGMTLAKQIRKLKDPDKSKLPIIAISGNYKNYTPEDFEALGIKDYLIKPLDYDKLVDAVRKYTED